MTVTGWTSGIGANRTRPAAAMPASVATSATSRVDDGPASSHAKPAPTMAAAASRTATRPRAGSSAAQAAAAIATPLAARTHLDAMEPSLTRQAEPAIGRERRVVGDDEERDAAGRALRDPRAELRLPLGIDPAGRLVEHEEPRLDDRHRSQPEPLALAAREVARMPVAEGSETESLERDARACAVAADAECHFLER